MTGARPVEELAYRLTFLSDWHVGTGTGRPGDVDRIIGRDGEGLPYVRAKTVTGILRDAAEALAYALDESRRGQWYAWVGWLFGLGPGTGREGVAPNAGVSVEAGDDDAMVEVRPALFPAALRPAFIGRYRAELRRHLTFVKPGVAIDAARGTARMHHYRSIEMARKGIVLDGRMMLRLGAEAGEIAIAFLALAAHTVERLGGQRRRGSGRCRMELIGQDLLAAIDRVEACECGPPRRPAAGASARAVQDVAAVQDGWLVLSLRVVPRLPIVVQDRVLGNVVESLDHVPGTFLLPRVTEAFAAVGAGIRGALSRGDIIVLPATPEVGLNAARGLPAPRALEHDKDTVPFVADRGITNRMCEERRGAPARLLRGGYVGVVAESRLPPFHQPRTAVHTHNSVADEPQRPTATIGGVFAYEAIGIGRALRTEIRVRESIAGQAPSWWTAITGPCRLGRSSKDDFGEATIELVGGGPVRFEAAINRHPDDDSLLAVWVVSDAIVRGDDLEFDATVGGLARALGTALGTELRAEMRPGHITQQVRARRIESWQRSWRRPRSSIIAVAAGSCVLFRVVGDAVTPPQLAAVAASGIGERTAEGYGQVCFNPPLLTHALAGWDASPREERPAEPPAVWIPAENPGISPEHLRIARVVERAAWIATIRQRAAIAGADAETRRSVLGDGFEADALPPAQAAALRRALTPIHSFDHGRAVVNSFLDHVEQNERRKAKWPDDVRQALRTLVATDDRVWGELGLSWVEERRLIAIADGEGELRHELWPDALRALLLACIRGRSWSRLGSVSSAAEAG